MTTDLSMRAVVIDRFGDPGVLEVREVPRPEPGPDEILVRVRSSGLNRADLLQRRGRYPAPPGWPEEIPGLEYAGTVVGRGARVALWEEGDRVMGLVGGGGYAEYVVVHERTAVRVPPDLPLEDAGAVPEVFMTAFDALLLQVGLAEGETVLIHAVGSGVGTAALQLARETGAWTVGTSRTPEKVDRALALGLDVGIVADEAWPDRVLKATRGRGVDVILDLVGGTYLAGNQRVMAPGGRQIVVGVPSGARAEVDLRLLMSRRATIRGTVLRARPLEERIILARAFEARVGPLLEAGVVRPVVGAAFAPEEAPAAHRLLEANGVFGKIVLLWE